MTFSVSRLFQKPVPPGSHPLVKAEIEAGISASEAARRLGVSLRQYERYRNASELPPRVCLMVDLGALLRQPGPTLIEAELEKWSKQSTPA